MANPQKENGYTPIANELLEHICTAGLNATQYGIVITIWRYTYGFNRKCHDFSVTYLAEALGKNYRTVQESLADLIEANIVHVVSGYTNNKSRRLSVNKDYETWLPIGHGKNDMTFSTCVNRHEENTVSRHEEKTVSGHGENTTQEIQNIKQINKPLSSEPPAAVTDGAHPSDDSKTKRKSGGRSKPVYDHGSEYYKSAAWLARKIEARYQDYKKHDETTLQAWSDSARLMFEKDKRDKDMTGKLLRFSQDDEFWRGNILSMPKFRLQYDKLLARYQEQKRRNNRNTDAADSRASPLNPGYINLTEWLKANGG